MDAIPTLKLVCERKIRELIPGDERTNRCEASGVLVRGRHFFVVFDDRSEIARIANDLQPNGDNGLFGMERADIGFEGITYNDATQRFYLLVEARKHKSGVYRAEIFEYDEEFAYRKHRMLDFPFKSSNKGFEAVAHVRRDGTDFVLALCEGNKCKSGDKGRKPGGGRVQLLEKKKKRWAHRDTIELPESLPFVDYSGMSIEDDRVAVVSQENSMLWVGQFDEAGWTWRDTGQLYWFPRTEDGAVQYGNIEGVAWITSNRLVTVSDRRKKDKQPDKRLSEKDQSIHLFDIPE